MQGDPWQQFQVNADGMLFVGGASLDRESRDFYQLTIAVHDRATNSIYEHRSMAKVRVNVQDVNDNAPSIPAVSQASVAENAPVGTVVTILTAQDADAGLNGVTEFHLDTQTSDVFSIDPVLGYVKVNRALNRQKQARHHLKVYARDRGQPPLVSAQHLIIYVLAVRESKPQFAETPASLNLAEDAPVGSNVYQFSTTVSS